MGKKGQHRRGRSRKPKPAERDRRRRQRNRSSVTSDQAASILVAAVADHQAGRLDDAEAKYEQVLQQQPGHPDALHLLGVVAHHTGRHEMAVDLITQAIAINNSAATYRRQPITTTWA